MRETQLKVSSSGTRLRSTSADVNTTQSAKMPRMQHIISATARHCQAPDQVNITKRAMFLSKKEQEAYIDKWHEISSTLKRQAGHRWALTFYYLPILFDDAANADPLSTLFNYVEGPYSRLDNLLDMDLTECLFRALTVGTLTKEGTRAVFSIGSVNEDGTLRWDRDELDAFAFVEKYEGSHVLELIYRLNTQVGFEVINAVFFSYARFILQMVDDTTQTMKILRHQITPREKEEAEVLRNQGNERFKQHDYPVAILFYSEAIKYDIQNHVIYGNRSLCFLRLGNYQNASIDGKRAVVLKPDWAKGHYRYCEALYQWGHENWATQCNTLAYSLCQDDPEGLKDLLHQAERFNKVKDGVGSLWQSHLGPLDDFGDHVRPAASRKSQKKNQTNSLQSTIVAAKKEKEAQEAGEKLPVTAAQLQITAVKEKAAPAANGKDSALKNSKKTHKSQSAEAAKAPAQTKDSVCKEMASLVQQAHTALVELQSRSAERTFNQALTMLETVTAKKLGLSFQDVHLLRFGRASALIDIGQTEDLAEARKLLEQSQSSHVKRLQMLFSYCSGRIYLKECRFAAALNKFNESLQILNNTPPSKFLWPLIKQMVRESEPDLLKEMLSKAMEICKFPPPPDIVCQVEKKSCPSKAAIYFSDPDFKGFIQICCCEKCVLQYHIACWKTIKSSSFNDKSEREFLQEPCFTPDCAGKICNIKRFDSTNQVKWEDGVTIFKPEKPKRPKVNQPCISLKKLKNKEERKLKRKQKTRSLEENSTEEVERRDEPVTSAPKKAVVVFRDGVLRQISEKLNLLREERAVPVSMVTSALKPWLELDLTRDNLQAEQLLSCHPDQSRFLGAVVEMLLERKNRVWARIFVHVLSSAEGVNPKLSSWASRLNEAGLNAARTFVECNVEHLEQLDLAFPLTFGPFQDVFLKHLVSGSDLLGSTLTNYLKEAPADDIRLFIWTLDEHKENYIPYHKMLDDYFDMMEGHCAVLKKSTEKNSPAKPKNRARKKKRKEPKELFDWSDGQGTMPPEEWDQSYIENQDYSILDPDNPFSVPSHLRDPVYEFENQYNNGQLGRESPEIYGRTPDPTEEYLVGYFTQVLEQHGPQLPDSPLLMEQLENFPENAKLRIQEAGGLESFLLLSPSFVKIGEGVGLSTQAWAMFQSNTAPTFQRPAQEAPAVDPHPYEATYDLHSYQDPGPSTSPSPLNYNATPYTPREAVTYHRESLVAQEIQRSVAMNTEPHQMESVHGEFNKKEKGYWKLRQLLHKLSGRCEQADAEHQMDVSSLQEEIREIQTNTQVTNTELSLFQQKLEEEVKNDQKEKKANQELLKSSKQEISELQEENKRLNKSLMDTTAKYQEKLRDFLELGNQMESEKMRLEEEIKSLKASVAKAGCRSRQAQISVVESYKDLGLYGLNKQLAEFKVFLSKLDERFQRFPSPDLDMKRRSWKETIQELEKKIAAAERQYQDQIELVRGGENVSRLIPFLKNIQSTLATPLMSGPAPEFSPLPPTVDSASLHPKPAAAEVPRKSVRPQQSVFEKAMEKLSGIFPDYSRADLMGFMRSVRSSSGGNLGGMDLHEMIMRVTQLILDHQDGQLPGATNPEPRGAAAEAPAPVWQKPKPFKKEAINLMDQCIICYEEMTTADSRVLDCGHTFHVECISLWLKEQSTCPTCRGHTISTEEFPALSSRRRQIP